MGKRIYMGKSHLFIQPIPGNCRISVRPRSALTCEHITGESYYIARLLTSDIRISIGVSWNTSPWHYVLAEV